MPQLQNNNRAPVKVNDGHAAKGGSYINEVEAVQDHRRYPNDISNGTALLNGLNNVMNNLNSKLQNFALKTQQLEAENKFNEYQLDSKNLTKNYKFNYQRQPSEELTKQYENDLQQLKDSYENQMPNLYKNEFLQRTNLLDKQENLEFFRRTTDLEYQSKKYLNNLYSNLDNVADASFQGNFEMMENEVMTLPLKKQQLLDLYGDIEGNKLYDDYSKKLIKSYMDGRLASQSPKDVLDMMTLLEKSPEFRDKLSSLEMEHYRIMAEERQQKIDNARKTQEVAEYFIKTNLIINDITNQKLNNYSDIVNRLLETGTDEYESKLILGFAGYTTQLPPELLEKNKGGTRLGMDAKELSRKKTDEEKTEFNDNIQSKIFSLYEGISKDDKELEGVEERNTVANRIKEVEQELLKGLAGGYLSRSEHANYTNQLQPYMSKVLDATAKGNFDDDNWYSFELGYGDLQKGINEVLERENLLEGSNTLKNKLKSKLNKLMGKEEEDPDEYLKGLDRKKYYFLKNNITSNYIKSMDRQFREFKNNDVNGKYADVNNWIEFQDRVDRGIRKRMYNKALDEALSKYARNEMGINLNNDIINPKTGEVINRDLLLNKIQEEEEKLQYMDLMYKLQ